MGAFIFGGEKYVCKKTKISIQLFYKSRDRFMVYFSGSNCCILFIFDRENYVTLVASLIGVTSLIFNAKGNPFGQFLMVIFSILYGAVSFTFSYYGEMITYLGMTAPMAVFALVSWLKNPYNGNKAEVKVNLRSWQLFIRSI